MNMYSINCSNSFSFPLDLILIEEENKRDITEAFNSDSSNSESAYMSRNV